MNFEHFECFYDYYLLQHRNRLCRRLHFTGTTLAIILLVWAICTKHWNLLWLVPLSGYGLAWLGHFLFEGNKPASFKNPILSFRSDIKMYLQMLMGKITF